MNNRCVFGTVTLLILCFAFFAALPAPAAAQALSADAVIVTTNSVHLSKDGRVTGNIVVNDVSPGPFLNGGVHISLDKDNVIAGDVIAPTIKLDKDVQVDNVCVDTLSEGKNVRINGITGPYSTSGAAPCQDTPPIFDPLPPFRTRVPGGTDLNVPSGGVLTIPNPGNPTRLYNHITVGNNGTVIFAGGDYGVASISADKDSKLLFQSPTALMVAENIDVGKDSEIGPTSGSGITASEIIIYVAGSNADPSDPNSKPAALQVDKDSTISANLYAPNGTFRMSKDGVFTGAVIARDVRLDKAVQVFVDGIFSNRPPAANPRTLTTLNDAPVVVTLTGSDPEEEDLAFSIVTPPVPGIGALGAITPVVPAPVEIIDRNTGQGTGEFDQPPVTSAEVTYTPVPGDPADKENSFVFAVTDPGGLMGTAAVNINPDDPTVPDPEAAVVDALDAAVETRDNTPVTITLSADSPRDPPGIGDPVPLTFSITTLPAGSLMDEDANSIESVPFVLPSPQVIYTPPAAGSSDSFQFKAEGTVGGSPQSDVATITISILEGYELAPDQSVGTPLNQPVQFDVVANSGGIGDGGGQGQQSAQPIAFTLGADTGREGDGDGPRVRYASSLRRALPGADIAGNVSATDGVTGDGKDNLPGGAPVFVSAGVDVNLGGIDPSGTYSGETAFLAELDSSELYDFEQPAFPAASAVIGPVNGIDFFGRIGFAVNPPPPSGSQFMRGTGSTAPYDEVGVITFPSQNLPNAVGFVTGFGSVASPAPFTRVRIYDGNETMIHEEFIAHNAPGGTYFGFIDTAVSGGGILWIELQGMEADQVTEADAQQFGIDDLTIGSASAGSGGGGVSGVARIQMEWEIGSLGSNSDEVESCEVTLTTNNGTVDSLDTTFFPGTGNQNGTLDFSDFEAPVDTQNPLAVMPVFGPQGVDGIFAFSVTNEVKSAIDTGFSFFSVQGRVDEGLADGVPDVPVLRGLQIRSTATGNLNAGTEPQLTCVTTGTPTGPQLTITLTQLPAAGAVTFNGQPVFLGQTFTSTTQLLYTPPLGQSGTFSLGYLVTEGAVSDTARIDFIVAIADGCVEVGRLPGCSPGL